MALGLQPQVLIDCLRCLFRCLLTGKTGPLVGFGRQGVPGMYEIALGLLEPVTRAGGHPVTPALLRRNSSAAKGTAPSSYTPRLGTI